MKKTHVSGINEGAKAHFLSKYVTDNDVNTLLAVVEDNDIDNIIQDLKTFLDGSNIAVLKYPRDDQREQIITLSKINDDNKKIIVTDKESLNACVLSTESLKLNSIDFKSDSVYKHDETINRLSKIGYTRESFVEEKGQFAVRGEILDIWPCDGLQPVRFSFDFNTLETIKTFDYVTQRSDKYLKGVKILPCSNFETNTCIIEELPRKSVIYSDYKLDDESEYKDFDTIINSPLEKDAVHYDYQGFQGFQGNINYFIGLLKEFKKADIETKIYCSNMGEKQRIIDIFYDNGWAYEDMPEMILMPLWQGFYLKNKLIAVSTKEILYKRKQVNFPKINSGRRLEGIWEISSGDYVVHEKYGIGKYKGLKKIVQEGKTAEYLCIEYKRGDKLYVPPDDFKVVEKYVGVEGVRPKLYSMDTFSWERVKSKARREASEFAKELLKLYAQRCKVRRVPYPVAGIFEKELADSFAYEETEDQLKAIEDISSDFSKPYPMERLICGDVGFGKTEVALRAAFKVACQSKQVAVLVPTTVLAEQHYNTFVNRLSAFPVNIEALSRFQKPSRQKEIAGEIKKGNVDIIIGTHRLLQKDIEFKDLGLLIIDEEHRFGVKQKEKIKMLKKNIDMIMLSATPIPRTLSGALYGLRDLSLIETQPLGRLPIETTLSYYDKNLIKKVIEAELSRNGQVFYVYNRVETILNKALTIKKLIPDINLAVIHGQLKPLEIEKVMWRFLNKEIDVLLATTIIESGIDIPTVNTMIIEDAQNFGLSQLHQLRGRIGRDKQKAYCYLFYNEKNLSNEAVKRLEAMKEFSDLGSGYRLALKDLEIRGAGGILSSKQHGFVRDVGYEMFSRMLEEEGKKVKGIKEASDGKNISAEIDLQTEAFIPQDYIEDEDIRILFYRKISNILKEEDIFNIETELKDRFGKLPEAVNNLFEVSKIKIKAEKLNIERLSEDKKYVYIYMSKDTDFNNIDIMSFINDYKRSVEFSRTNSYCFKIAKADKFKWKFLNSFLDNFKKYIRTKEKI
ncbi:MAG: transcription-repair coupling factor [Endomicrobiaceae bacterium]